VIFFPQSFEDDNALLSFLSEEDNSVFKNFLHRNSTLTRRNLHGMFSRTDEIHEIQGVCILIRSIHLITLKRTDTSTKPEDTPKR
jgi:hypothetical protein